MGHGPAVLMEPEPHTKRGRKAKLGPPFQLRLTEKQKSFLEHWAVDEGASIPELIRRLVSQAIKEHQ